MGKGTPIIKPLPEPMCWDTRGLYKPSRMDRCIGAIFYAVAAFALFYAFGLLIYVCWMIN